MLEPTPEPCVHRATLGKPSLTLADAIAQSMAIGPVFSGATITALIAGAAGLASPLVTLLGTLGALCIGWVVAVFARRCAHAGMVYEYVRRAMGPKSGIFAAGLYFAGMLLLGVGGIYIIFGIIAARIFHTDYHLEIPWWIFSFLAMLLIFAANYFGIKLATRAQLVLTGASVLPFLVTAFVIIWKGGAHGYMPTVFSPAGHPPSKLFKGLLFAVVLFQGFEASASLGEETAEPFRSIPRAVFGTVVLSAVFYLVIIYASAIGFGAENVAAWAGDPAPINTLARRYVGNWIVPLLDIALSLDILAVASTSMVTASRGLFALARHGLLPKPFTKVSRYDTPTAGNLFALSVCVVYVATVALAQADPFLIFGINTTGGSILIQVIYALLALVVVRAIPPTKRTWWQYPVILGALLTPTLAVYGVLSAPGALDLPGVIGVAGAGAIVALVSAWAWVGASKIDEEALD